VIRHIFRSHFALIASLPLALSLCFMQPVAIAQPGPPGKVIKAKAFASADFTTPGSSFKLAVQGVIEPGFHINANKPLDEFAIPTQVKLNLPKGMSAKAEVFPASHIITFAGADTAVYDKEFLFGAVIECSRVVKPGTRTIEIMISYQACNDESCFPPQELKIKLPLLVKKASRRKPKANKPELFKKIQFPKEKKPLRKSKRAGRGIK
jgi:thioredoxin:protein disulfide reductase